MKDALSASRGKGFKTQSKLNIHLTRHGSEKAFKCLHCPKSYKFDIKGREHVRVHTGEKPYECRHCENAFALLRQRMQRELVKLSKVNSTSANIALKPLKHLRRCGYTPRLIHRKFYDANGCPYVTKMATHKIKHANKKLNRCDQRSVHPVRPLSDPLAFSHWRETVCMPTVRESVC